MINLTRSPSLRPGWLLGLLLLGLSGSGAAATPDGPEEGASTADPTDTMPPAMDAAAAPPPPATPRDTLADLRADCALAAERALARSGEPELKPCDLLVAQLELSATAGSQLPEALGNRAVIFATAGELELALADLDRAAATRPDDPVLALDRSFVLLHGDRPQEALALLDPLIRQPAPVPGVGTTTTPAWLAPALINRALVLRSLGDDDAAAADLRRARRLVDSGPGVPARRGEGAAAAPSSGAGPALQPAPTLQ